VRTLRGLQGIAPALGLTIHVEEIKTALEAAAPERAGALVVPGAPYTIFG